MRLAFKMRLSNSLKKRPVISFGFVSGGLLLFFFFSFFPGKVQSAPVEATDDKSISMGKAVYERYCLGCHGATGNGKGPFAAGLNPAPRDFTGGTFKWTRGPAGSLPSDEDLMTTVSEGVRGTAMPPWQALRVSDRWYVIAYIKTFSRRFLKDPPAPATFIYPPPDRTEGLTEKGKAVFVKAGCPTCHGPGGRGDGPSAGTLQDDWGAQIFPANFTRGVFKTGKEDWKIYRSIANGIGGTPMPSYNDQLKPEEIWELVFYLRSLNE